MKTAKSKFYLILGALFIALLCVIFSMLQLNQATEREATSYKDRYTSYLLATELRQSSDDLTRLARVYSVTGDPSYEQQYWDVVAIRNGEKPRPQEYNRIYWDFVAAGNPKPRPDGESIALLDLMKQSGFSDEELAKLNESKEKSDALVQIETVAMNAVKGKFDDGHGGFTKTGLPDMYLAASLMHGKEYHLEKEKVVKPVDDFFVLLDKRTTANVAEANSIKSMWQTITLGAVTIMATLLLIAATFFSGVLKRLGEDPGYLHRISSQIASGNLDIQFNKVKIQDSVFDVMTQMVQTMKTKILESENLASQMSKEVEKVNQAIQETDKAKRMAENAHAEGGRNAAEKLSNIATILNTASEELSSQISLSEQGAEVQARRVAETATAMEEMNATVLEVAHNASTAAELAENAKNKALDGAGIVGNVVNGINNVQTKSMAMKNDMEDLGKQAEAIGEIMNVISDIADQTNLLALNAAIEAARAGDAGRGFAVVADEVRKLAEKTMQATTEVGNAIKGVQSGTHKNMENVDLSVKAIEETTELAKRSGEALEEIVNIVESVSSQIMGIATSSEQQSAASNEINKAIDEVNTISAETAQAMHDAESAVSELANQSNVLTNLIEQLRNVK